MQVSKSLFLVRIDKVAQNQKRSKAGDIIIPENHQDMMYNLQYGNVVAIGKNAHNEFPEVEIDDILIFHHHVEYKPRTTGDKTYSDPHLVETLEDGDEIRTVNFTHEVFGVLKPDTQEIIPFKGRIFCHEHFEDASFHKSTTGLFVTDDDAWRKTDKELEDKIELLKSQQDQLRASVQKYNRATDEASIRAIEDKINRMKRTVPREIIDQMRKQIDQLKRNIDKHESDYRHAEEVEKAVLNIYKEREKLTRDANTARLAELTILYINPETNKRMGHDLKAGDKLYVNNFTLYPLDIDGIHFTIAQPEYVSLVKYQNMKKFFPLHDRVLITPIKVESKTAGGIIIPETATKKPNQGVVEAIGPGTPELPTTLQPKDEVLFGRTSGVTIEIDKKEFLLMREGDIYGSFKEVSE